MYVYEYIIRTSLALRCSGAAHVEGLIMIVRLRLASMAGVQKSRIWSIRVQIIIRDLNISYRGGGGGGGNR